MPAERPLFSQTGKEDRTGASERINDQGDQRFSQDAPKKRGRPRLLSDAERRARLREYNQRYYQEHKEDMLERNKRYYEEQKNAILEQHKRYRQEHKHEIKLRKKRYRHENAEKRKVYLREWRRKRKQKEGITSDR